MTRNYGVFITKYKVFELIFFSAMQKGFDGKENLLRLVDFISTQNDHTNHFTDKILVQLKSTNDIFPLMESLLEP